MLIGATRRQDLASEAVAPRHRCPGVQRVPTGNGGGLLRRVMRDEITGQLPVIEHQRIVPRLPVGYGVVGPTQYFSRSRSVPVPAWMRFRATFVTASTRLRVASSRIGGTTGQAATIISQSPGSRRAIMTSTQIPS